MRLISLLVAALLATPAVAQTDTVDGWPTTDICRASVQVYFLLSEAPRHRGYNGFHQIQSAAGNSYKCQVAANNMIRLIWTMEDGGVMRSESTRYAVLNGMLTVTTDISEQVFVRDGAGYRNVAAQTPAKDPSSTNFESTLHADDCKALRAYSVNSAESIFLFSKANSEFASLRLNHALDEFLNTGAISEDLKEVASMFSKASDHVDYQAAMGAAEVLNRLCPQ